MNVRLVQFLAVGVARLGHRLFRNWGAIGHYLSHFQPGNWPESFGSSILHYLDAANLLGDLRRSRDLGALGKVIQIPGMTFTAGALVALTYSRA
jgi:hypothetical protein